MKSAIYQSRGKAREFEEHALNHYAGCAFGCLYCMAPLATHTDREKFHAFPRARLDESDIRRSAAKMEKAGVKGPVLLSFVTDPYQPIDGVKQLTRRAILALQQHGMAVTVLTKAGELAMRDFDILHPGRDTFATTLTCLGALQRYWEPGAAPAARRLLNLREAHRIGLKTWVSCEPVVDPDEAVKIIEMCWGWAGHFKIGPLNYHEHRRDIDWKAFADRLVRLSTRIPRPFYLKADLAQYLGVEGGLWLGQRPEDKTG
jgi:DNA repair photolyase